MPQRAQGLGMMILGGDGNHGLCQMNNEWGYRRPATRRPLRSRDTDVGRGGFQTVTHDIHQRPGVGRDAHVGRGGFQTRPYASWRRLINVEAMQRRNYPHHAKPRRRAARYGRVIPTLVGAGFKPAPTQVRVD